ncbi:MAG: VOC family protein [Gemmatimonas sp.]
MQDINKSQNHQRFEATALQAALTVADLNRSVAWYTDALGFEIAQKHERDGAVRSVSLRAGNVRILLNQDNGARGTDREKGSGMSFMITTSHDIDALAGRVKASGSALESEPTDTGWGMRVFRVRDPDGFLYAISSEPRRAG